MKKINIGKLMSPASIREWINAILSALIIIGILVTLYNSVYRDPIVQQMSIIAKQVAVNTAELKSMSEAQGDIMLEISRQNAILESNQKILMDYYKIEISANARKKYEIDDKK